MSNIIALPTELLEQIISHLDYPSLLSCLYQNQKIFSIIIPLIWKELGDNYWKKLGDNYWKGGAKTILRWNLISDTLSLEKTFVNYATFVQKIDLSCSSSSDFRIQKRTLFHLLTNGNSLKEIDIMYHKEPLNIDEPFECLREITSLIKAPIRKVTMNLLNVSPTLIISLFANYIDTLEELKLRIIYELSPFPLDDLRLLVKNNQKLQYMELHTIEGARIFNQEELNRYRLSGELPNAKLEWASEVI